MKQDADWGRFTGVKEFALGCGKFEIPVRISSWTTPRVILELRCKVKEIERLSESLAYA